MKPVSLERLCALFFNTDFAGTAEFLGVTPERLREECEKYGINPPDKPDRSIKKPRWKFPKGTDPQELTSLSFQDPSGPETEWTAALRADQKAKERREELRRTSEDRLWMHVSTAAERWRSSGQILEFLAEVEKRSVANRKRTDKRVVELIAEVREIAERNDPLNRPLLEIFGVP